METEYTKEFMKQFNEKKELLGIKTSFEELDNLFYLTDMTNSEKLVSSKILRSINRRISEVYNSWGQYCYRLLMPSPNYIPELEESKILSEKDKKEITKLMNKSFEIISENGVIALSNDEQKDAEFMDKYYKLFIEDFKPKIKEIMTNINLMWKDRDVEETKSEEGHRGIF